MHRLHDLTPCRDKLVIAMGSVVASTNILSDVQTVVGIIVGLLTVAVLIPRVINAWKKSPDDKDDKKE